MYLINFSSGVLIFSEPTAHPAACEEGPGICTHLLTLGSLLLLLATFPLSLFVTVKVRQFE